MTNVLRAMLVTLLLALIVSGGIWLATRGATGLRKSALAYFETWWRGEPNPAATAMDFEGSASDWDFEKMRVMQREQLGAYEGPGDVLYEEADDKGGKIGIGLRFEQGTGTAHLEFVVEDNAWKVAAFRLDVPRESRAKAPFADPHNFCRKLTLNWAKGHTDPVWEQFAPPLRERMPSKAFADRTATYLEPLGEVEDSLEKRLDDDGGDTIQAELELKFEQGTRRATLELVWQSGRWLVTEFDVEGFA
ncbi:MAG: hypothetical protein O2894_06790 [Planctomycetota bacterium]|nr:hypothetical protein [Planctomycetota bacterium]